MKKREIHPTNVHLKTAAFSAALQVGDFLFVAGQGPYDEEGKITGDTIEAQTTLTLENIQDILRAAGASLNDVVKVTVYLSDLSLFDGFNKVYTSYFSEPKPVRTTVGCHLLDGLIEIDVIACKP